MTIIRKMYEKAPRQTFELRLVGPGVTPEVVPLRAVSDALAAIQDLASGRDPYETPKVDPEQGIGLIDVRRGSAVYACYSRAPDIARNNLNRVQALLSDGEGAVQDDADRVVSILKPIKSLSEVARSLNCELQVRINRRELLFSVKSNDYERLSKKLLMDGDSTVYGKIERVGGATEMKCVLRIPDRRQLLYCTVRDREVARQLAQHLYESIVATGKATWIHSSWRIVAFSITGFTQPQMGNTKKAIERLRNAGLSAWDDVPDPEQLISEQD